MTSVSKPNNPFAFKPYDEKLKKENADNYLPPKKRLEIKQYLGGSSVRLQQGDRGFDGVSRYKELISDSEATQDLSARPTAKELAEIRRDNKKKHNAGNMPRGHSDERFQTLGTEGNQILKAPANYSVATLEEMKKDSKDHHYSFGMRGIPTNYKQDAQKHYETAVRDAMSERPEFMRLAKETENRVRKSNF